MGRSSFIVEGFTDIHSHILFGLDDGAETEAQSVEMIRLARRSGTIAMVATPHASAKYRFEPRLIAERLTKLQGTAGVQLYSGCDFHLQYDNIEDAIVRPTRYVINGGSYLLVEFSDLATLHNAEAMLGRLLDAGLVPVITHPERNPAIQRRVDEVAGWVATGCCVQVTAGSFTGMFGRSAKACAEALLAKGLVHVVASDAHDCQRRTPDLSSAYVKLADAHGEDRIRPFFVDNPSAIVANEAVGYDIALHAIRPRRWFQFWA